MLTRRLPMWLTVLGALCAAISVQAATPVGAYRFSELKSLHVENAQGEKLGKIDDLVYDANTGEIRYAAVSFGGFLGVGNKLFAVPWHALKVHSLPADNNRHYVHFLADRATLKAAPGFNHDQWPDIADPKWSGEVDKFYATSHPNQNRSMAAASMGARASNLLSLKVENERNETLGDVSDIVVDTDPGKIRYAAIAVGGLLGVGDRLFAVPFDALRAAHDPNSKKYHIVLNADKEALKKAPGFDKDHWPDFANSSWATTNDKYYQQATTMRTAPGTTAFKSKDLIGLRVENAQRENLGKIDSLVIDLGTGKVRYAAVSFGGFLGIGNKLFAIPWEALKIRYDSDREANSVVLNVDKTKLEQAKGFDSAHWPNFADAQWASELHTFYGTTAIPGKMDTHMIRRTSDILGTAVQNAQGEKLGTIDELVLDLPTGTVRYAAMSFGGFLGIGDKLFAVPWKSIEFRNEPQGNKLTAVVQLDKGRLQKSPNFDRSHWPDFANPNWSREIDQHYRDQASNR